VRATPSISSAVPTSTPTRPGLGESSAGDARRGAHEEEGSHRRRNMAAPGTKKPDRSLIQTLSKFEEDFRDLQNIINMSPEERDRTVKKLDCLIEEALRKNERMMPFYKRWYMWYKHWKLQYKYWKIQRKYK
jgi:hypothetical protein